MMPRCFGSRIRWRGGAWGRVRRLVIRRFVLRQLLIVALQERLTPYPGGKPSGARTAGFPHVAFGRELPPLPPFIVHAMKIAVGSGRHAENAGAFSAPAHSVCLPLPEPVCFSRCGDQRYSRSVMTWVLFVLYGFVGLELGQIIANHGHLFGHRLERILGGRANGSSICAPGKQLGRQVEESLTACWT